MSFSFDHKREIDVAIVRKNLKHTGHDLNDPSHNRTNKLDENLVMYIECLLSQVYLLLL